MPEDNQKTILVVDDEETNIDILLEALGEDYDVSVAMDGEGALENVEEEQPDLILLDVMMPGMDGYEVCQKLKADSNTSQIPIIFISGKDSVEEKNKGLESGAVDYITKPFNASQVLDTVKKHI